MDYSTHPTIVEYAVRECNKHKSPKAAAAATQRKLAGSRNLLVGGGIEIVEIDEQQLENQIRFRMAERVIKCIPKMNMDASNAEDYLIGSILQEFGQKNTPKNAAQLKEAVNRAVSETQSVR